MTSYNYENCSYKLLKTDPHDQLRSPKSNFFIYNVLLDNKINKILNEFTTFPTLHN